MPERSIETLLAEHSWLESKTPNRLHRIREDRSAEQAVAPRRPSGRDELSLDTSPARSTVEHFVLIHPYRPQRAGCSPGLVPRRVGIGDQQRPARRPASIARRDVQQIDVEQQDIAGLAFQDQRIRSRVPYLAAMGARHELRAAIRGAKRIEEGKRGNLFGELRIGAVSMQLLRPAAGTRFASL